MPQPSAAAPPARHGHAGLPGAKLFCLAGAVAGKKGSGLGVDEWSGVGRCETSCCKTQWGHGEAWLSLVDLDCKEIPTVVAHV